MFLWLLSVSLSAAMPAHRQAAGKFCDAKTTTVRKLVRQVRAIGGPVANRPRVYGIRLHPLTNWLRHDTRQTVPDDEQAIQNDSAAADFTVDLNIELRRLGAFLDPNEPRERTRAFSPRAPRGPPHPA